MTGIRRMDHFTVVTDQAARTRVFYEMLGLRVGPRPDFGIDLRGVWLYAEERAVLHVVEQATMPALRRGVLDHMAFWGEDIGATLELLLGHGIAYSLIRLPRPWSTWQVFFEDPNGAEVEIDFDASEQVPSHPRQAAMPYRPQISPS